MYMVLEEWRLQDEASSATASEGGNCAMYRQAGAMCCAMATVSFY